MLLYILITVALAWLVYALRRNVFGKIALMLCTLSICFTALETYYRFFYARSDGFGRLSKNFAARYYHLDGYGLRASNLPPSDKKDNIVVLGDSHVFGAGLKAPSERLAEQLAARLPAFHVLSLGYPGWDTQTEIEKLIEHLDETNARVPLVVLGYFFNDIEEDVTPEDRARFAPPQQPRPTAADHVFQWLSNHSRFVELFYYRVGYPRLVHDRLEQIRAFYRDAAIRQRHLTTLERLRDVARERYSANLLVVLLPYLHSEELLRDFEFYNGFTRELSARGFQFVDMQPTFAREGTAKLVVHRFDPHTNAFANQLTADEIVRYLKEHPELLQPAAK